MQSLNENFHSMPTINMKAVNFSRKGVLQRSKGCGLKTFPRARLQTHILLASLATSAPTLSCRYAMVPDGDTSPTLLR